MHSTALRSKGKAMHSKGTALPVETDTRKEKGSMKFVGFVSVDAHLISRGEWWKTENVPKSNRKGDPEDLGYAWYDADDCPRWMNKVSFEQRYVRAVKM